MSNYTDQMVAAIEAAAPLNLAKAHALASDSLFAEVSYRSIISKARSLGVAYEAQAKVAKATTVRVRKSDVVAAIARDLNADADALAGLAKADQRSLAALAEAVGYLKG